MSLESSNLPDNSNVKLEALIVPSDFILEGALYLQLWEKRREEMWDTEAVKEKHGKSHGEMRMRAGKLRHYKCHCLTVELCQTISSWCFMYFQGVMSSYCILSIFLFVFGVVSFFRQNLSDSFYWFIFLFLKEIKRSLSAMSFLFCFHPGISPISMCSAAFGEGAIFS